MLILETKSMFFSRYIHGAVQNENKKFRNIFIYSSFKGGSYSHAPLKQHGNERNDRKY